MKRKQNLQFRVIATIVSGLLFVFVLSQNQSFANGENDIIVRNESVEVTPSDNWQTNYPCCRMMAVLESTSPEILIEGDECYPDHGEILLGEVSVYDRKDLLRKYEVLALDGIVAVELIEEY